MSENYGLKFWNLIINTLNISDIVDNNNVFTPSDVTSIKTFKKRKQKVYKKVYKEKKGYKEKREEHKA